MSKRTNPTQENTVTDALISGTAGAVLWKRVQWVPKQGSYAHTKAQYTALVEDALAGKDVQIVTADSTGLYERWSVLQLPYVQQFRLNSTEYNRNVFDWQPGREFLLGCDAVTRDPDHADLKAISELIFASRRARHEEWNRTNGYEGRALELRNLYSGTDLLIAAGMLALVRETWLPGQRNQLSPHAWDYERMYSPDWNDEQYLPTFAVLAAGAALDRQWGDPPTPPGIAIDHSFERAGSEYRIAAQHAAQALAGTLGWPMPRIPGQVYSGQLSVPKVDKELIEKLAAWGDGPLGNPTSVPNRRRASTR